MDHELNLHHRESFLETFKKTSIWCKLKLWSRWAGKPVSFRNKSRRIYRGLTIPARGDHLHFFLKIASFVSDPDWKSKKMTKFVRKTRKFTLKLYQDKSYLLDRPNKGIFSMIFNFLPIFTFLRLFRPQGQISTTVPRDLGKPHMTLRSPRGVQGGS